MSDLKRKARKRSTIGRRLPPPDQRETYFEDPRTGEFRSRRTGAIKPVVGDLKYVGKKHLERLPAVGRILKKKREAKK